MQPNQQQTIGPHFSPELTLCKILNNHLIFYVTRFSIGWKIGVILYHLKKIDLWRICSKVAEYSSAIEYSAEINHGVCKVLLHNIYVFDIIKWYGMNLFALFGDGAITRKKNDGNFASCATCNDTVSVIFWGLYSITKQKNKFIP
jgi:hypothetical protein